MYSVLHNSMKSNNAFLRYLNVFTRLLEHLYALIRPFTDWFKWSFCKVSHLLWMVFFLNQNRFSIRLLNTPLPFFGGTGGLDEGARGILKERKRKNKKYCIFNQFPTKVKFHGSDIIIVLKYY